MKGFSGNKVLLPLIPESNPFSGTHPIIAEIIDKLPSGPKALVVHHKKEEVMEATRSLGVSYCDQPVPNGTGGALIAAKDFLEGIEHDHLIITMGDVPFVKTQTYQRLISSLHGAELVVLGFKPEHWAQYGLLEVEGNTVKRITEWKYWKDYPLEQQNHFEAFNAGIYAAKREPLLYYITELEKSPHMVRKERGGHMAMVEEYFITDLVELMTKDGLPAGFAIAEEEQEVMGIDTMEDLLWAQKIFSRKKGKNFD